MADPIYIWLSYLCGAMALCGLAFQLLCLLGARDFRKQKAPTPGAAVPVSILKPLKGADPEMYESFRSHCLQDRGDYEILFGVNDAGDEAVPYVERLKQEFPQIEIRLIVCPRVLGTNRKVSNLIQLLKEARYEHVIINDSDIRVPSDYLTRVTRWFSEPEVGMVTCPYRAIAGKTLWSKLESLGIAIDFIPPMLAARFLEGRVYFGLGSTLAASKKAIQAMGGLEQIVDHLADDYELGTRIADAGQRVVLANVIVETFVHDYRFGEFRDHQLRWWRTVRSARPAGYAGMIVIFGVFWSVLAMVFSGTAGWSVALLAANLVARVAVAALVGAVILRHNVWPQMWMMPFRDLYAPLIWAGGLFGDKIVWRGETFQLKKGKLVRA